MRHRLPSAILSAAAGLVLLWHAGGSGAQPELATGEDADVTEEGLHRVHPSIMEAAWVRPDLDLSRYTRILVVPTAVQFRDVRDSHFNARTRISIEEFPLNDENKTWFRESWQQAVDARFSQEGAYESYDGGDATTVLVVQGVLVDVVSRIPPFDVGSSFNFVRDPWSATVVLELRDPSTGDLLARTVDRRNAEGLLQESEVWVRTEDLLARWAQVMSDRLEQLVDVGGGRGLETPTWAR